MSHTCVSVSHCVLLQVIVRLVVSDLGECVPGIQLFTAMKRRLVLNLTMSSECDRGRGSRGDLSSKERGCNHGDATQDHIQSHGNIRWHIATHSHRRTDTRNPHSSDQSRSCLHIYLLLRSPVSSTADPSSVLLSIVLPQTSMDDCICDLSPSGNWTSVVSAREEFSLEVVSCTSCMWTRVVWTISSHDAVVISRTTEDCNINVSLPKAGRYTITVQTHSQTSWASFQAQIVVQDPVGELPSDIPSRVATNQKHLVSFNVTAGSDMTVCLLANETLMYRNSSSATGAEAAAAALVYSHTGTVMISLRVHDQASSQKRNARVRLEGKRKLSPQAKINPPQLTPTTRNPTHDTGDKAVSIYAAKRAYPTNTDIILMAEADVPDPVEFLWHFGDSRSSRTSSRAITKRYHNPGSYDVFVVASRGQTSITSDVFQLVIQRAVKLNRLVHRASVLQNQTVTISCRVNVGTNVSFLWSFGDGTTRSGQSAEQHVFHRTGEFRVEVIASNLVSTASLNSHIFVVDRPCQPPPVKNMGPLKLQVRRYEVVHLGVTYETEVDCDISGGLRYSWTLSDSAGRTFPLPLTDTFRQSLILQGHLLQYDTYTATARVEVVGSVVYSNYSVRVQVIPSPPVAFIQGGSNVFVDKRSTATVTLDGRSSYDPDSPGKSLSYSWTCKPVSSIPTHCFDQHVPTSAPLLEFPVDFLKHNFDQFQFTLTVHSGERSASSETFLTVTSNPVRKVSVTCPQCHGDHVNWDQTFSVSATCEDCDVPAEHIRYSWSLYLVNASSKPVTEVPFCYTVDLRALAAIMEDPVTPAQTPAISTLHLPVAKASQYTQAAYGPAPSYHTDNASETKAKKQNLDVADSAAQTSKSRNTMNKTGGSESEPSDSGGELYSDYNGQSDSVNEFLPETDSSADWESSFSLLESGGFSGRPDSDYDLPFPNAEEGDPGMSAGRPAGVDGEDVSAGDDLAFNPALHEDEGSNLVDSKLLSVLIQEPTLLDLLRNPVDRGLFESYTYTGTSSSLLRFRPFSLRPRSTYMLEVTAESQNSFLGRTQLFLKTNPVPAGMTCQVQPDKGVELHTHFSIFCTSGKEDLLYKYSFSVGDKPPRTLYQGRDFQYYFSLPSGDPSDDYKVTIYTEISNGAYGSYTKPCPVSVQVQPGFFRDMSSSSSSHHDPGLELSEESLRNLSVLVQLGNGAEIRNYVSLLSGILNRLSLDTEAKTQAHKHMRHVLICTVCELESSEEASVADAIHILKDLLVVTRQVTLVSARRVTAYVQVISESRVPDLCYANEMILNSLVGLLSYNLQVATSYDFTPGTHADVIPDASILNSSARLHTKQVGAVPTKQVVQLVSDILQTATDLILKYILFKEIQEHRVSTGLITLHAASQNQISTVISGGSATFHLPAALMQIQFVRRSRDNDPLCVLSVVTEISHSPYTWASSPFKSSADSQLSGPVVDLSLYKCSTRRKIPVHSFVQPIITELRHPQRNKSSAHEHILLRSQVNYHSFNITQEHLQRAVQLTVVFTPPPNKPFPVMLLFRMFERPTPSMHHLHKTHHWKGNTARITLPPFYLNTAGIGHLALLNAEFGKAPRSKHPSEHISYSLTVDSSLCLSWDGQQGAWTHHGCRTQQADTAPSVNCSCHQLRPLTVTRQQIESSHGTESLDPFLSASGDLTVLGVLMMCLCLYIPVLVVCKRADATSEENQIVHHLPDNSPSDPYLYAVTIHTGLCSVAAMSAKVYIVLHGEDGHSQTRELQVPGCSLFRRNSQDTFLLSAADSLGPVWGIHIWHDNSGPSPDWYLQQVEVSEVNRRHVRGSAWLFISQCWLAANRGDGRVERMLRVCTQRMSFAKVLCLKLSALWSDFHIWISVHSCPRPHSFTQTQRLGVCLMLLLGYACVSAVIISQTEHQLELSFEDMSDVSVRAGLLSVLAVLPAAAVVSFLFRMREVKLMGSRTQHAKGGMTENDCFEALSVNASLSESHLSWGGLQQWAHEAWRKKHQDTDLLSVSTTSLENKDKSPVIQPSGVVRKEDALAFEMSSEVAFQKTLLISKESNAPEENESDLLTVSSRIHETQRAWLSATREEGRAVQKDRVLQGKCSPDRGFEEEGHRQAPLHKWREQRLKPASQWCHCLAWSLCLFSSLSCLVLCAVLGMRFSSSEVLLWIHSLFFSLMFCIFLIQPAVILTVAVVVSCWYKSRPDFHSFSNIKFDIETGDRSRPSAFPQKSRSYLEKRLEDRQRARYLRLVRPPTPAELRKTRGNKRKEALIHKTLRDLSLCASMIFLMMCITCGSSYREHYHLNKAVTNQFKRSRDNTFMSIQSHEDWWTWTQTNLLDLLYKNASDKTGQSHILIGDPVLQKMETSHTNKNQVLTVTLPRTGGHLGHYAGQTAVVSLGYQRSDAASKLELLHSSGWLDEHTAALKVQFTFYSPAPNLFTSVTLLTEQSPTGVLLPSAKVHSARVYHTTAVTNYLVMVCQLLFLFLSLLQLHHQVSSVAQQGLMGYQRTPLNWVEVGLLTVTLAYYVYHVYHSVIITEARELLQRHKCRGSVDVSLLASCEQIVRTLRGVILFLLTMKCVVVLRVNRTLATSATLLAHSLSTFLWPTVSGLILMLALSCAGNLLYAQSSWAFSSVSRSLQTLLSHHRGFGATGGLRLLSGRDFVYCGVFYLSSTVAWTAVVIPVVSSLIRGVKRPQSRRNVFTVAELAGYIRQRVCDVFTGKHRPVGINNNVQRRTYYLEEFETLVDELLFRLNALSNSLHHTLPPKAHLYREEGSPVVSPTPLHSSVNTQDSERSQMMVNDPMYVGELFLLDHGETSPASHLLGSQVELEILQVLQQRGQLKHNSPLDTIVASDYVLKGKNMQESAPLERLWAEGVQEKQGDKWTRTNERCWLSQTHATHAEVMVEVLVHEEPGRVDLDTPWSQG
ncbi:polycystic kidney disease 1 like 1 [Mugil cephalus]|uniref:polycystic kidney disease 1 like 1 n=1 Tax=Mugil cephalus TaxID=48193 RepID=UPI001FB6EFB6|nr:polycystic kidney disease 1 like 1 [Mugil cephalus]